MHYRKLVNWGIEPAYAVQMATFLQSHLQKALEHKLVTGKAPEEDAAIFQLIHKSDNG